MGALIKIRKISETINELKWDLSHCRITPARDGVDRPSVTMAELTTPDGTHVQVQITAKKKKASSKAPIGC